MANAQADNVGLFKLAGVSMSKLRKHGSCNLLTAAKHNKREIQAEIGYDKKINPALNARNRCLAGATDATGVVALAADAARSAGVDVKELKVDYCQALELIFSLPNDSGIDEDAYFSECLRWTGKKFPGLIVLSADQHGDEAHPHLHILLSPFKDGVSVSRTMQSSKTKLELAKDFFESVAGPAGLKRAQPKLFGQVKAAAIRAVVQELRVRGAHALPIWSLTLKHIESNTLQYVQCLGIDLESLRADIGQGSYDLGSKVSRSYDLQASVDNLGEITQGHTCDDLVEQTTTKSTKAGTHEPPGTKPSNAVPHLSVTPASHELGMAALNTTTASHLTTSPSIQFLDALQPGRVSIERAEFDTEQGDYCPPPPAALVLNAEPALRRKIAHAAVALASQRHFKRPTPPVTLERTVERDTEAPGWGLEDFDHQPQDGDVMDEDGFTRVRDEQYQAALNNGLNAESWDEC